MGEGAGGVAGVVGWRCCTDSNSFREIRTSFLQSAFQIRACPCSFNAPFCKVINLRIRHTSFFFPPRRYGDPYGSRQRGRLKSISQCQTSKPTGSLSTIRLGLEGGGEGRRDEEGEKERER